MITGAWICLIAPLAGALLTAVLISSRDSRAHSRVARNGSP